MSTATGCAADPAEGGWVGLFPTDDAAVTLPRAFGTLAISLDGEPVATVEADPDDGPSFRPLDAGSDSS